jgi:hypothetical protein
VAWSRSGWHGSWAQQVISAATSDHSLSHPMRAAVYDDNVTPDYQAGGTIAGYGQGPWAIGEVPAVSQPGWPRGGQLVPALAAAAAAGGTITVTGGPVVSPGLATFTAHGGMIYDTAAAAPVSRLWSLCAHWYGGPVTPQDGTFTIVWGPAGIAVMTCPLVPVP